MKRSYFLALTPALVAVQHFNALTPPPEPTFAPDVVQSDLDGIWTTLIAVGAEPFRTSNQADVEALYKKTRISLTKPMTLREAWLAIAPVLGALNDGHVGLGFPDSLNDAARAFPLFFALSATNEMLVVGDNTKTVAIGSRLVSINDVPAETFRDVALATGGGQTETLRRTKVTMSGSWPAIALFGAGPTYRVVWMDANGVKHQSDVLADPPVQAQAASAPQPYTYRALRNGSIGYIDYRSCRDLEAFKKFLVDTFQTIKLNPIRELVIDIRRNGGGDSALNDVLWTYVTTKSFKQSGPWFEKSSVWLKGQYGPEKYKAIYGEQAWDAPDGKILHYGDNPNDDLIHPGPQPLRYNGPVYLLISARTFSSAMSCALAAKDYGLATIVGQETGEPVNSTGEVYAYTAPGTGLRAYLTTKVYLAPKAHPNDQGVVPDIAVATTPADIAAGRDPVLERVLNDSLPASP